MIGTMQTLHLCNILGVLFIIRDTVNAVCPDNCNTCESYDKCTSCKLDKWNLNASCLGTCNNNCLNQECQDDNGYCLQCEPGLYGLQCQRNCTLCENALCGLRACTLGCKSGYFAFSDGIETFCQACRLNCRSCSNTYACDVCNDGFYVHKFISNSRLYVQCNPCPDRSCKAFCTIQDCNECQVLTDTIVCTECREGFELDGDICVLSISECSQGCSTSCDEHGICLGSCNNGWTGDSCYEPCAIQCLTCARNNANVCEQCKEDFYTMSCNIECPERCNVMMSKQTCNIDDGYCLNGCNQIFCGMFYNNTCPDGCVDDDTSKVCQESNGFCTLGCKDGSAGPKCDISVSTTPTVKSEGATSLEISVSQSDVHDVSTIDMLTNFRPGVKDNNNVFITGYFSGIGSAALVASVIVAICCIRRRFIKCTSNAPNGLPHSTETHTYYNERIEPITDIEGQTNGRNNYETLNANIHAEMTYSELQRQI